MERTLYLINQQYYPEVVSTGQVFQTIAEYLAHKGWTVHVVTGTPFYPGEKGPCPKLESLNGVTIHRLPNTTFPKASFAGKLMNQLTFMFSLLFFVCARIQRDALVLVTTAPPLSVVCTAFGAFFRRYRVVMTVQDLYPDVLAASGASSPDGFGYRFLHRLMGISMRACEHVITISTDMQQHLKHAYGLLEVELIPNLSPGAIETMDNQILKEARGWGDKLIVQYSGNFGVAHECATLLGTMCQLRDDARIHFHITGDGRNYDKLRAACEKEALTNVTFEGYAPLEMLNKHLALADVSIVIFNAAFRNVLLPSKYYGILASGRAVALISGCKSDIERDIEQEEIGASFAHGQSEALADSLRTWQADRAQLRQMGRRARALYDRCYRKEVILESYERALARVLERGL